MTRITAGFLIMALLLVLSGCAGGPESSSSAADSAQAAVPGQRPTDQEAKEAFLISLAAVLTSSLLVGLGQKVTGVVLNQASETVTLNRLNVNRLFEGQVPTDIDYISGKVTGPGNDIVADLTIDGGPVTTLQYTIAGSKIESQTGFTVLVIANGHEIEVVVTDDDLIE